ncbi:MAG: hypothetical protein AAF697_14630 [Pseudomonadota bacterium]
MSLFLDQQRLFMGEISHARLIDCDERVIAGANQTVNCALNMLFQLGNALLEALRLLLGLRKTIGPDVAEDGLGQIEQIAARAHLIEQSFELAMDLLTLDRLALGGTAILTAQIIGVGLMPSPGPTSGHRMPTIAALDKSAQREVDIEINACRSLSSTFEAGLDLIEGSQVNKRFVLSTPL